MPTHFKAYVMIFASAFLWLPPARGDAAYLDPGSGSFLLQILVAGLLGAGFVIKSSWGRIKGFFGRGEPASEEEQDRDSELDS